VKQVNPIRLGRGIGGGRFLMEPLAGLLLKALVKVALAIVHHRDPAVAALYFVEGVLIIWPFGRKRPPSDQPAPLPVQGA
jgi:hypothetical protein